MNQPQPSPLQVAFYRAERSLKEYSKDISCLSTFENGMSVPLKEIVVITNSHLPIETQEDLTRKAKSFLFKELEN